MLRLVGFGFSSSVNLISYEILRPCSQLCAVGFLASGRVLSDKLNLNYEEAERWIVNLITTSKLDAKIDSKSGTVVMEPNHPNV